jgi:nucleotide-binding universal stress UspA family protein
VSEPIILVPLDGTEDALIALPVAKALSDIEEATLHILHVAERKPPTLELLKRLGLEPADLHGSTVDVRTGEPAAAILEAGREATARLIVMCTQTAPKRRGRTLGGTAFGVLRDAPCPVVLVRPERGFHAWHLQRVLLPHDGTPVTSAAIPPATELARRVGAELVVLYVAAAGKAAPRERGSLTVPFYLDQPHHEWPAWASEFIERLACVCTLNSLRVRLLLGHGNPGAEIVRVATEQAADLIFLAWRGRWAGKRAATLKAVVRQAPCPTMIVRV